MNDAPIVGSGLLAPATDAITAPAGDDAALHQLVAHYTSVLLAENRELLLSVLYRIDVPEARVRHAFATAAPGDLPDVLAGLMIERHRQKLAVRAAYRAENRPSEASSHS